MRHPAIRETGGAAHDHLALAPHPDGDRALDRQWIDPGVGHAVPLSLEGHQFLRPQGPHEVDLLLDALPSIREVLAEGLELDRVPADADTETKPSPGQDIHRRRLLRHQRGLPLRQDQDSRDQLHATGDAGQEAEQDEGLVEGVPVRVRTFPAPWSLGVRAEHMVEGQDVRVAHRLDRLGVVA